MAKDPKPLYVLSEDQATALKIDIEKIEKIGERVDQLNADKRVELDRVAKGLEPLGFTKQDVVGVIGRRKKDRDRTVEADRRIARLEVALGMTTADLFQEAENALAVATTSAEATDASLAAGNVVSIKKQKEQKKSAKADLHADTVVAEETPASPESVKAEGLAAWARGAKEHDCKYPDGSEERSAWLAGWNEAQAEWNADQTEESTGDMPPIPASLRQPLTGADYRKAVAGADL